MKPFRTFFIAIIILISQITFAQTNKSDSLLFDAIKANDLEQVKLLIEKGANVNAKDDYSYTALSDAFEN